mmetsp:Transcript_55226/g.125033  ORF Transcript_55226/g.125033 Transcript_55226/m.125033 type:complete len:439 (-) Transcript_55226:2-1318(-)
MSGSRAEVSPAVLDAMEEPLLEVEQLVLSCHKGLLARWSDERRLALRSAAELDDASLLAQAAASEACISAVEADIEGQRAERREARIAASEFREECEDRFYEEVGALGDAHAAEAAEIVAKATSKVRAGGQAWEDREWEEFDRALRTILWHHAKKLRGASMAEGVAEVYESGELQHHLAAEKDGWSQSQTSDANFLRAEIDAEFMQVFDSLDARLKELAPENILAQPSWPAQLSDMAAAERKRLVAVETELLDTYEPDISTAMRQLEKDYRSFDAELQSVLARILEERIRNAASMRRLKLALCHWRLDYQKTYHDQCSSRAAASSPTSWSAEAEPAQREMDTARRLVLDLWSRSRTPVAEIHRFLGRVAEASAKAGAAEKLLQVYEEELQKYGALPLLEHADRPELLECWLQALQKDGGPGAASLAGEEGDEEEQDFY